MYSQDEIRERVARLKGKNDHIKVMREFFSSKTDDEIASDLSMGKGTVKKLVSETYGLLLDGTRGDARHLFQFQAIFQEMDEAGELFDKFQAIAQPPTMRELAPASGESAFGRLSYLVVGLLVGCILSGAFFAQIYSDQRTVLNHEHASRLNAETKLENLQPGGRKGGAVEFVLPGATPFPTARQAATFVLSEVQ